MPDRMTESAFSQLKGEKFQIDRESDDSVDVELIEVQGLKRQSEGSVRDSFSIVFRGPEEAVLQQGTYAIHQATLGEFALFLVPVGMDEAGALYEAVFN